METRFDDTKQKFRDAKRDEWVRCSRCRHKLFKLLLRGECVVEVKCSSCKNVNLIDLGSVLTSK